MCIRDSNQTVLVGDVRDQAHLYGLLDRLRDFGIELVAVENAETRGTDLIGERDRQQPPLRRRPPRRPRYLSWSRRRVR